MVPAPPAPPPPPPVDEIVVIPALVVTVTLDPAWIKVVIPVREEPSPSARRTVPDELGSVTVAFPE